MDRVVDAVVAVALAALAVVSVLTADPDVAYPLREPNAVVALLALTASLPLAVRRRWPLPVSAIVTTATLLMGAFGWNPGFAPPCVLLGLYAVAAWGSRAAATAGLVIAYAAVAVLFALRAPYFDHPLGLLFVAALTTAWVLGRAMRRGRRAREWAVARALAAERDRAVHAERAMLAERLHIARELHDVVAHTLSVIAVQAGTARYQRQQAGRPLPALATIETASRAALDDLRRMVGLLRAVPAEPPVTDRDADPPADPPAGPVRERLVDAVVAVALAALGIATAFVADPSVAVPPRPPNALLVGLILLACLPLAVRRRWPLAGFLLAALATVATTLGGWDADITGLAAFVALYTVTAWRPLPIAVVALGVVLASDAVFWVTRPPTYDPTDAAALTVIVPFGLGLIVRRWRRERDDAHARALDAERTRAAEAERAAFAERLRLAGELHDVVTHTLSVIAVQSAVARHQAGDDAVPALTAVEEASRAALEDLRRMLGVLDAGPALLRPTPDLAELDVLVSAHRAAHGPVTLTVGPDVREAPPSIQLTAFRLVQEALTNVRKHAPGATATVHLGLDPDGALTVRVDDDGRPRDSAATGGFGLAGMRERAALFGGTVAAGPRPGGGWSVEATLRTVNA